VRSSRSRGRRRGRRSCPDGGAPRVAGLRTVHDRGCAPPPGAGDRRHAYLSLADRAVRELGPPPGDDPPRRLCLDGNVRRRQRQEAAACVLFSPHRYGASCPSYRTPDSYTRTSPGTARVVHLGGSSGLESHIAAAQRGEPATGVEARELKLPPFRFSWRFDVSRRPVGPRWPLPSPSSPPMGRRDSSTPRRTGPMFGPTRPATPRPGRFRRRHERGRQRAPGRRHLGQRLVPDRGDSCSASGRPAGQRRH